MVSLDSLRASVLTTEAENASDLLMLSAGEHERFRASTIGWSGDPSSGRNAALSYVMRCVILVEVFLFERALTLSDNHAGTIVSPVFDRLYAAHRDKIVSSWNNALLAIKDHAGVTPKKYVEYPAMDGYIFARNSWAHGHGKLTDRQLKKDTSEIKKVLSAANFSLRGGHVIVDPDQVLDVARTCRRFVRKVDKGTRNHL